MAFIRGSPNPDEDEEEPEGDNVAGGPPSPDKAEKLPNSQGLGPPNRSTFPANFRRGPGDGSAWVGKVAIIRDMAAITYGKFATRSYFRLTCRSFEAMIYFLYTGQIRFASTGAGPRHELPAEERAGDWNASMHPSPSAKSIYRLADKVTVNALAQNPAADLF